MTFIAYVFTSVFTEVNLAQESKKQLFQEIIYGMDKPLI